MGWNSSFIYMNSLATLSGNHNVVYYIDIGLDMSRKTDCLYNYGRLPVTLWYKYIWYKYISATRLKCRLVKFDLWDIYFQF